MMKNIFICKELIALWKNFSNKTLDVIEAWKYNKDNILNNFSDLSDSYKVHALGAFLRS